MPEEKKRSDPNVLPPISDPELPVFSGAVVLPDGSSEQRRQAMDRNRILLMLGSPLRGDRFLN